MQTLKQYVAYTLIPALNTEANKQWLDDCDFSDMFDALKYEPESLLEPQHYRYIWEHYKDDILNLNYHYSDTYIGLDAVRYLDLFATGLNTALDAQEVLINNVIGFVERLSNEL